MAISEPAVGPPLVALAGIHHVSIAVTDMDRAIEFWTETFGWRVCRQFELPALGARGAFLEGAGTRLELWALNDTKPAPAERLRPNTDLLTAGTKHVAFGVDDLPAALDRLRAAGVTIAGVQRRPSEPMRSADEHFAGSAGSPQAFAAFIQDPFGTLIELLDNGAD